METTLYPSDLTDAQWEILRWLLPKAKRRGRRPRDRRLILDGIFYVLRTGCGWAYAPVEYGPWKTLYDVFRRLTRLGVWQRLHDALRARVRQAAGKTPQPTAAVLDSQSVKTAEQGGLSGYDAGKKVKGRKRTILVDTLGLLLAVRVASAAEQDRDAARPFLERVLAWWVRLQTIFADGGYAGTLVAWVKAQRPRGGLHLEIVRKTAGQVGFAVLPKRWVVERTFGWLLKQRRLTRDYERHTTHSEAFIYIAMLRLMLNRLAKSKQK